jgi:hypothetical protein
MRKKMSDYLKNDEAQNDSESSSNSGNGSRNSDRRGNVRPLGNRFPKDPTLVAALRKHEKEWQAILASLSNSFGVSVNALGHNIGR